MRTINSVLLSAIPLVLAATVGMAQPAAPDKYGLLSERIDGLMVMGGKKVVLTEALKTGAMAMRSDFVIFGIELADADYPTEPRVVPVPPAGGTVGEFLEDIFRQVPAYEYEAISGHMVSVYPRGAKENPEDILNLKVPKFDVDDVHAGSVLGLPVLAIPELRAKVFPATPGNAADLSVFEP